MAVHNHYKRLQNKRMGRSAYPYEGSLANVPSSQLVSFSYAAEDFGSWWRNCIVLLFHPASW